MLWYNHVYKELVMKNKFYGRYYKFISDTGYTFALIVSYSNEGRMVQLVTPNKGYYLDDVNSVNVNGHIIDIDINQDGISLVGRLELGEFHPLRRKVMGPFTYLPLECKHQIYSMYHVVNGTLLLNKEPLKFSNARGYIEGDSGKNFPTKYIWYNSLLVNQTVTLAIATIPLLGFIHFTGLLCFIKKDDIELRLCTYNFARIISKSKEEIVIKKGKYKLIINISSIGGHDLKAPMKGNMVRYIKENINVPTSYKLLRKNKVILDEKDELSSLEYMY